MSALETKQALLRGAVVLSDKPWWMAYYGIEACARCERGDGLHLGITDGAYAVIGCDCNYQNIRDNQRARDTELHVIGERT